MATDDSPSDLGHTATMPAGSAPAPTPTPGTPTGADLDSEEHDLRELPTIDPETYVFGHYFARGGMGRIAAVRDTRLGRVVAIKELIASEPSLVERFKREIRITARLEHPSIVSVHEAGRWPSGEPFFAMRRVAGCSLKDAIAARPTLHERLGLVASVIAIVDALAYAHDRGVIHRDLKPANVLVGEFGETVVIDWGLAKDTGEDGDDAIAEYADAVSAHATVAGSLLGTPAYMAPEQARGEPADERSDVYALGAILYTVLAGDAPYDGATQAEIVARVLAEGPPPIGTRQRGVAGDLQAIVARAMARAPADRYPSARELAADLKRFQTGQLVAAHEYTRGELFARWLRRNRTTIIVGAAALAILVGLGLASLVRIVGERDRAVAAERGERARSDALVVAQARATVDRDPLQALRWLADLPDGSGEWGAARTVAADASSRGIPQLLPIPQDEELEVELSADGGTVAFAHSRNLYVLDVRSGEVRTVGGHRGRISDIGFSPDGTRIATSSGDNTVSVWNTRGGHVASLTGHTGFVIGAGFTRDGSRIVSTGLDRTTRLWLLDGSARIAPVRLTGPHLSGDGRWVGGLDEDNEHGAVWDTLFGVRVLDLPDAAFTVGADGTVAWVASKRTVALTALATGVDRKLEDMPDGIAVLRLSRDGAFLAIGTRDGAVHVIELATNQRWAYPARDPVTGLTISEDGSSIAAWGRSDATEVHVVHVRSRTGRVLPGSVGPAEISSDGARVMTRDAKKRVLLWQTAGSTQQLAANDKLRAVAVSPDGRLLAYGGPKESVRVWSAATREEISLAGHALPVVAVAWSPNGALLASLDFDKRVRLWDLATRTSIQLPGRARGQLAWSPDGTRLAAPSDAIGVRVWDIATGALTTLSGHRGWVGWVGFSPDGTRLAAGCSDGVVRAWDGASQTAIELGKHDGFVRHGAWSPAGDRLATAGHDGTVRVWPRSGEQPLVLYGHTGWVTAVAFDPTGRRLASVATDRTVWTWDAATGAGWSIGSHDEPLLHVVFSPDGATLATTGLDGARLWTAGGTSHRALRGHGGWVHSAAFFPDGKRLVTVSADATIRLWLDDLPHDPAGLRAWLASATR